MLGYTFLKNLIFIMGYVLINRKFVLERSASISITQRACRFGDGIFETCRIIDGVIYNYSLHEARIFKGLAALQIYATITNLKNDCYHLIQKNQIKNGILRISISRGDGSIGYLPTQKIEPLIIIETTAARKIDDKKIIIGISKIKAPKRSRILQNCKTMQSLNYILAKINAKKYEHFDDVMLSEEGFISECSSANIFWVKNNKIFTPSAKCDALLGSVRGKILRDFPLKINLVEASVRRLCAADEIFLTNASFLVLAVDELIFGKKRLKMQKSVGNQILQWFESDIQKYCNLHKSS